MPLSDAPKPFFGLAKAESLRPGSSGVVSSVAILNQQHLLSLLISTALLCRVRGVEGSNELERLPIYPVSFGELQSAC